ncbi:MAG: hypothetical protein R6U78_05900 [Bacteroidales bacterium]
MDTDLCLLIVAGALVLLPAIASRNPLVPALVLFSYLVIILPVRYGLQVWVLASAAVFLIALIWILYISGKRNLLAIPRDPEIIKWRIVARPFALLFIPIHVYLGEKVLLYLLGVLAIIFISTDMYRLFSRRQLSLFYKKAEIQRFSSMTSFLVAIFILFLLFPPRVSYLCLGFIIFGDLAAKISGLHFGRIRIIHGKTLAGSLGFLTGCLFAGSVICVIFRFPFSYLFIGALVATVAELFTFYVDDNFTIGILTGVTLQALHYFQVI